MGLWSIVEEYLNPQRPILVADDEHFLLEATALALRQKGYPVVQAMDGKEAVEMARKKRPVLIILDINMPVLDGWQVLSALRSSAATKKIPVVMLTTLNMTGQINKSFELGANGYLNKPLDLERLYSKVEELIGAPKK